MWLLLRKVRKDVLFDEVGDGRELPAVTVVQSAENILNALGNRCVFEEFSISVGIELRRLDRLQHAEATVAIAIGEAVRCLLVVAGTELGNPSNRLIPSEANRLVFDGLFDNSCTALLAHVSSVGVVNRTKILHCPHSVKDEFPPRAAE